MAVIEMRDVRKTYGTTVALDGIGLEVRAGEVFGLLGPNGAGKTTAVQIAAGLRAPDSGTVRVLGLDPIADGVALKDRLAVQLQHGQLPDRLRVHEALELASAFYSRPRPIEALMEQWGLAEKRDSPFSKLSGGQKQRLLLALSLVGDPEVVFFDEITTGLDPQARRASWDLVRKVRDDGVTVVLVSHLMDEVEELADRVAVLNHGRIVALDTPTALIERTDGEQRMRFRPIGELDLGSIERVPGVAGVTRSGSQVVVTGTGEFAGRVAGELARAGVLAADLRVERRTLDDAYLALTGSRLEPDADTTLEETR
jgi:ABC-2 type transport system ATP-binding protein